MSKLDNSCQALESDNENDILDQEDDVDMDLLDTSTDDISLSEDVINEETEVNNDISCESEDGMKNDETVPEGWRYKGFGYQMYIKSPYGVVYRSRRHAFEDMIQCGKYSMLEIINMKSKLLFEGWNSSDKLPRGWMIKKSGNKYRYLGQGGELFSSSVEVKNFVKRYEEYFSAEDVEKVRNYGITVKTENHEKTKSKGYKDRDDGSWTYDCSKVPEGWGLKEVKFGSRMVKKVISPEGKIFNSRRIALKYLVAENSSDYLIESMRACLKHDGWSTNENLPVNWFYKYYESKKSQAPSFLTSTGHLFTSKESAMVQLVKENKKEDLEILYKFVNPNIQPKSLKLNKKQKSQGKILKMKRIDKFSNNHLEEDGFSFNHPNVPIGWGAKEKMFGKRKLLLLASRDGKVFQGKRKAIAFMVKENYSEEQIEEMRQCLMLDGWLKDENLPTGWFYKIEAHSGNWKFISPEGLLFKSKGQVIEYLRKLSKFDELEVFSRCLTIDATNEKRKIEDFVLNHPSVPRGWSAKEKTLGPNTYLEILSPNGQTYPGKRLALASMIKKNYPENDIREMRKCMEYDGWATHEQLPKDWLYKKTKKPLKFVSSEGLLFNHKSAKLHLRKLGRIDDENLITNFFVTENTKKKPLPTYNDNDELLDANIEISNSTEESNVYKNASEITNALDESDLCNKDDSLSIDEAVEDNSNIGSPNKKEKSLEEEGYSNCEEPFLKGWSFKLVDNNSKKPWKAYKSPSGARIKGKRLVLKYLLNKKCPEQQISALRKSFEDEGWKEDERLPQNWFYKKEKKLKFLSSSGNIFDSKWQALKFLNLSSITKNECEMLEKFTL